MRFIETGLKGAYVIEIEPLEDERGFFARSWCKREFEKNGLISDLVQCNISFNMKKGTIRGMHFQKEPYSEAKLVRTTMGSIFDVIIDLRADSSTYRKWISVELNALNRKMLYIPFGFAHGFQTLQDNTEVFYQMTEFYHQECSDGVQWDDPAFNIKWPLNCSAISEKDLSYNFLTKL